MKYTEIKTGIIGCGNIGTELANFLTSNSNFALRTLTDVDHKKAIALQDTFIIDPPDIVNIDKAIRQNDLIIESAGRNALPEILNNKYLDRKKLKILCMSSGGLIKSLPEIRQFKNVEFLIPSGAIAGLDAINAVSKEIKTLALTTTKPAQSLVDAQYVVKNKISLDTIKEPTLIFEGGLQEAIIGFPQNINVAASLFIASGFNDIKIKIIADPDTKFNTHEIKCSGSFGIINTKTQNLPSKNPKTSYLAILSAQSILSNMTGNIRIGG